MAECAGGCGMTMEKEKMIAHEHDGDTTYFCSEKCQEAFMAKEKEEGAEEEERQISEMPDDDMDPSERGRETRKGMHRCR